jgi:hypothetical protein
MLVAVVAVILEIVLGMLAAVPIGEADRPVVISLLNSNSGIAGIENPLYFKEDTRTLFGDATRSVQTLVSEFKGREHASQRNENGPRARVPKNANGKTGATKVARRLRGSLRTLRPSREIQSPYLRSCGRGEKSRSDGGASLNRGDARVL